MLNKDSLVNITPYDPQWPGHFRQEAAVLESTFGQQVMAIHHIGSTSVPGLSAKPIIDIMLEVYDIQAVDRYNDLMRSLGYEPLGEYGLPRRRYFRRIINGEHISHVHTWQTGDPEIERHISFRDYLISNKAISKKYGLLKEHLVRQFAGDKECYIANKHDFCQEIEQKAVSWSKAIRDQIIKTERLTLLPLNPAQLWQCLYAPSQLEAALHIRLSQDILQDPVPQAMRSKLRKMNGASPHQLFWNTYWLVIIGEKKFGGGLIGFKGAPELDGMVDIGYGIDSNMRRQGYATESVKALTKWALAHDECELVSACTKKENTASIRVLEKVGFVMVKETGEAFYWILSDNVSE